MKAHVGVQPRLGEAPGDNDTETQRGKGKGGRGEDTLWRRVFGVRKGLEMRRFTAWFIFITEVILW